MIVGSLSIRMVVHGSRSLKDKRRVVKSLKDRIRNTFNVSVSEVDYLDSRQMVGLGVAVCTNSKNFAEEVLSKVVNKAQGCPGADLVDYNMEFYGV